MTKRQLNKGSEPVEEAWAAGRNRVEAGQKAIDDRIRSKSKQVANAMNGDIVNERAGTGEEAVKGVLGLDGGTCTEEAVPERRPSRGERMPMERAAVDQNREAHAPADRQDAEPSGTARERISGNAGVVDLELIENTPAEMTLEGDARKEKGESGSDSNREDATLAPAAESNEARAESARREADAPIE